jgi:hypothetical protein
MERRQRRSFTDDYKRQALDDSFLWTRGYTTVWSGWENNLGPLTGPFPPTGPVATASFPIAHGANNATLTGPGYE